MQFTFSTDTSYTDKLHLQFSLYFRTVGSLYAMYMYTLYCMWDYQGNKHLEFDSIVSEKPPRDRNIFAFKISNHLKGENIFAIKVHPA